MGNFGGLPAEFSGSENSRIAIVPVPYDDTSTWIKGADMGPAAIIEASANMELYDIETGSEVYLHGIHTTEPVMEKRSPEKMVSAVSERVSGLLRMDRFPVILGGNHSVSIGSIRAFAGHYGRLTVLQLDAHSDLRDEYEGSRYNHACVMARAMEVAPIVQVGIRATDSGELSSMDRNRVFFAHEMQDNDRWMEEAIGLLSENVYLTVDLDVFDPSVMPSTGTPEPGGMVGTRFSLSWKRLQQKKTWQDLTSWNCVPLM